MTVDTGSTTELADQIAAAFEAVPPPPAWCITRSREGDEPALVERDFRDVPDWRLLAPKFLDQSPDGLASALSFFSDEAFRYYLPAYLLADLRDQLQHADVFFHLTHGLDNLSRDKLMNPIRYGSRTWFDAARHRFSIFDAAQREAIACFLEYRERVAEIESERRIAREAVDNYWRPRA